MRIGSIPTTSEWLDMLIDGLQDLPVLLIVTFRPEFQPRWTLFSHVTALSLSRLGRDQGAAIVDRVAGGKTLPPEVRNQILAKTEGVPLFVEELTKTVLESGLLVDEGDHYVLSGPLPSLAIPSTLQDSLMARLDRLAPVKEVAQIGACIGRVFHHRLLAAVTGSDERHGSKAPCSSLKSPNSFFDAASRPKRPTRSSMRWCRIPPIRACSRAGGSRSTPGSRQRWSRSSQRSARPSLKHWRTTTPPLAWRSRLSTIG